MNENLTQNLQQDPIQTTFSQQKIDAYRPLFTPSLVIIMLLACGFVFLGIGLALFFISSGLTEIERRYDDVCENKSECTVSIELPENLHPPVFLYYKLTNFFQNHENYVNSRSDPQLQGEYVTPEELESTCDGYVFDNETGSILVPAGAVARSFFNDTFEIDINSSDYSISWKSDSERLFNNYSTSYTNGSWLTNYTESGQNDEHFIVWMRTSPFPTFLKIYAKIDREMPAHNYTITIDNNYPTDLFHGEKYIVLTNLSLIGGKNQVLAILYLVTGSVMIIFGFIIILSRIFCPRNIGDLSGFDTDDLN